MDDLARLALTRTWIREQIAECDRIEERPLYTAQGVRDVQRDTAVTQRRTLEAVLARLEGRP